VLEPVLGPESVQSCGPKKMARLILSSIANEDWHGCSLLICRVGVNLNYYVLSARYRARLAALPPLATD
jgi:hypothetical protein